MGCMELIPSAFKTIVTKSAAYCLKDIALQTQFKHLGPGCDIKFLFFHKIRILNS